MNFKKWVRSIQTACYNGLHTVDQASEIENWSTVKSYILGNGNICSVLLIAHLFYCLIQRIELLDLDHLHKLVNAILWQ